MELRDMWKCCGCDRTYLRIRRPQQFHDTEYNDCPYCGYTNHTSTTWKYENRRLRALLKGRDF